MANPTPSQPPTTPVSETETQHYWCYSCNKRVSVETLRDSPDNLVCFDCKNGFVESLSANATHDAPPPPSNADADDDIESFGRHFIRAIRLLAHETRGLDAPMIEEQPSAEEEYVSVELNELTDDDEDEDGERDGVVVEDHDDEDDEEYDEIPEIDEDELRRRRGDSLQFRLRIGDGSSAGRGGRSRILDWAEILLHLEDESVGFCLDFPDSNLYVGNPGDYVDGAEFEALLQNLAESDNDGRRGAPPASKEVVAGLLKEKVELEEQVEICAVCKDSVRVGQMITKLPCGHGYHGDCIVPWLGARNNCPVCRFELPTDDRDYEEEKMKRLCASGAGSGSGSSSSN